MLVAFNKKLPLHKSKGGDKYKAPQLALKKKTLIKLGDILMGQGKIKCDYNPPLNIFLATPPGLCSLVINMPVMPIAQL